MVSGYESSYAEGRMSDTAQQWDRTPEDVREESDVYLRYIGVYLRAERTRRGLDQDTIASRVGKSRPWVSQVENGKNGDHRAAKTYAIALEIDFTYIVAMAEHAVTAEKNAPPPIENGRQSG